jgi:pilus assembly protein CpaC
LITARRLACSVALATTAGSAFAAAQIKEPAAPAVTGVPNVAIRGEVGPRCSGEGAKPGTLQLQLGKSAMMRLPEPLQHRSVGNPGVVQAMLVAPDTMYIAGIDVGTTNMIIQGASGACSVVDIAVTMDPSAFQAALAAVLPDEKDIQVIAAADSLVLSGTVSDAGTVARVGELAAAFVRRPLQPLNTIGKTDPASPTATNTSPGGMQGSAQANLRVVNMLNVSGPQQVMLEVKIAEVSKTLLEKLEAGATLKYATGHWASTLLSNFLTGTSGGLLDVRKSNGNQVTLEAQKQDGLVRILAEPNIMAISGQEGSFLAGGKIYIPVPGQKGDAPTLQPQEFGVSLHFTPTVLSGGRINLRVAPEVSELSREGAGISAPGVGGSAILPLITTRRASTTIQLYDGQSFAIGGLIKNNLVTSLKGLPVLGEVPILGALFRSTDYQQDRTELVFVITAHMVKPLPPNYTLPTDSAVAPTRAQLMLGGRLEGRAPAAAAPTAALSSGVANGFELK